MVFIPAEADSQVVSVDLVIAIYRGRLFRANGAPWQPLPAEQIALGEHEHKHYLGVFCGKHCYAYFYRGEEPQVDGFEWCELRSLLGVISDELFQIASMALQLTRWYREHQFCGVCGNKTHASYSDRARVCGACDTRYYPRISPCVIGLVQHGDKCLLAQGLKHPEGIYSTLAGFIDPSDSSAEAAFAREVREEVGLEIENIRYFGSQAWPFPSQMMIGFYADYTAGEIDIDEREIIHADWFSVESLPTVPPTSTIAGRLIHGFIEQVRG